MARVRWSKNAEADFDRYSSWIWREAAAADAEAWLAALLAWVEQLADFPRLGAPRDDLAQGVRSRAFRKSVLIAYTVGRRGDVTILRVFGQGRNITGTDFRAPQ